MAEEDLDQNESTIAARGMRRFAEHQRLAAESDDEVEVPVQESEESEEPEETETPASQRDRRSQRGAQRASSRERAAAAEATAAVLRERLEALESRGAAPVAPQAPQGNPLEHIDRQIRKNYEDQEALHETWAQKSRDAGWVNSAEAKALKDRAIDLDVQKSTLVVDRREAQLAPQRAQQARTESLRQRAPDVYAHQKAFTYASGLFMQKVAAGMPDSVELHDQCCQEAREVVLGKRPAPDAAQRQRASGMSSGNRAPAAVRGATISMPKGGIYDKMALAAFPNEEPGVARQKWANTVGKKLLAKNG